MKTYCSVAAGYLAEDVEHSWRQFFLKDQLLDLHADARLLVQSIQKIVNLKKKTNDYSVIDAVAILMNALTTEIALGNVFQQRIVINCLISDHF